MPTYDYECSACEHAFEKFQSMSAAPIRKCPACGKNTVKRLIGIGAGVIFKGGGFYETDYRSDAYKQAAQKDADAAKPADAGKDAGKGDAAKTESKPAAKAQDAPTAPSSPAPSMPAPAPASGGRKGGKSKSGGSANNAA